MKQKLQIKFIDGWKTWRLEDDYFYKLLSEDYDLVISDSPDYVFSVGVSYANTDFNYPDAIKIVFCTENRTPDFNRFDYALGFDHLFFGDRYLRMPLFATYPDFQDLLSSNFEGMSDEQLLSRKFCSFVVSNGWDDQLRLRFFEQLSKYKRVDSGGRVFNNVKERVKNKREFCRQYKFNIAFENSSYPGYTTEKIVQALAASSIPIYYGNPIVSADVDPACMVSVHGPEDVDRAIAEIIALDNDDNAYLAKCHANKLQVKTDSYKESARAFFKNIFAQNKLQARRIALHGAQRSYRGELASFYDLSRSSRNEGKRNAVAGRAHDCKDPVEFVAQYYDTHSDVEDNRLKDNVEEFELTLAAISEYVRPGMRILDMGGGTGVYSVELGKLGCDVLLTDISKSCLELAKKNAAAANVHFRTMEANAMNRTIDVGDSYDLIVCLGPLYHCSNAFQAEDVIFNVMERLRAGGVAVFALLSRYSKFNDMCSFVADWTDSDVELVGQYLAAHTVSDGDWCFETRGNLPVSFVFPESAERIFKRIGLTPKEIFAVDPFHDKRINHGNSGRLLKMVRGSARKLCLQRGNHILVVVRKGDDK